MGPNPIRLSPLYKGDSQTPRQTCTQVEHHQTRKLKQSDNGGQQARREAWNTFSLTAAEGPALRHLDLSEKVNVCCVSQPVVLCYSSPSRRMKAHQALKGNWLEPAQPASPHRQSRRGARTHHTRTHPRRTEEQETQDTNGPSGSLACPQVLLPGLSVTTSFKTQQKPRKETFPCYPLAPWNEQWHNCRPRAHASSRSRVTTKQKLPSSPQEPTAGIHHLPQTEAHS